MKIPVTIYEDVSGVGIGELADSNLPDSAQIAWLDHVPYLVSVV